MSSRGLFAALVVAAFGAVLYCWLASLVVGAFDGFGVLR